MKVLVTGATGFVGNNVTRALLAQGCDVRVLVRRPEDKSLAGLEVTPIIGDLRDADVLLDACVGVDRVIHVAAKVHIGWSQLAEHREINVEGTRNVGSRRVGLSSPSAKCPSQLAFESCHGSP